MNKIKRAVLFIVVLLIGIIFGTFVHHKLFAYIEPKLISFPFSEVEVCEKQIMLVNRDLPYEKFYIIALPENINQIWNIFLEQAEKFNWYERKEPFQSYWPFEKDLYKDENRKIFISNDNKKIMACQILRDYTMICILRNYDMKYWDEVEERKEYIKNLTNP